jgi:hypothetical protein
VHRRSDRERKRSLLLPPADCCRRYSFCPCISPFACHGSTGARPVGLLYLWSFDPCIIDLPLPTGIRLVSDKLSTGGQPCPKCVTTPGVCLLRCENKTDKYLKKKLRAVSLLAIQIIHPVPSERTRYLHSRSIHISPIAVVALSANRRHGYKKNSPGTRRDGTTSFRYLRAPVKPHGTLRRMFLEHAWIAQLILIRISTIVAISKCSSSTLCHNISRSTWQASH